MSDYQKNSRKLLWVYSLIILGIGILIGFFMGRSCTRSAYHNNAVIQHQSALSCKTCAQIRTCDEAKALLAQGCLDLDRDRDGIPCENLCKKK